MLMQSRVQTDKHTVSKETRSLRTEVFALATKDVNTAGDRVMVELSAARWRWCRLFRIKVVQFEADLLSSLGAYRPRLSSVVTRRCV